MDSLLSMVQLLIQRQAAVVNIETSIIVYTIMVGHVIKQPF
jgi:hypothetical protein